MTAAGSGGGVGAPMTAAALPAPGDETRRALARRWRGQPGRLEVLYATVSDPKHGIGLWVHHELVSPLWGGAYVHGWCALFHPPAPPVLERVERRVLRAGETAAGEDGRWPAAGGAEAEPPALRGRAGQLAWDLAWDSPPHEAPLFTFPRWAWEREVLPGAQVVAVPSARFAGSVRVSGTPIGLSDEAKGAVAHIYGHGNAERWGWLHAELGGGEVLEVVAASSRLPGLSKLPPMSFVQLRAGGRDWPRDPLAAAALLRAELGLPRWRVGGTVGRWRLRAEVEMPLSQSVSVGYLDPDGASATCTNSEVADAEVVLEHRRGRWETAARWRLEGTAHAEIGTRP
jgi:hypothetical protein